MCIWPNIGIFFASWLLSFRFSKLSEVSGKRKILLIFKFFGKWGNILDVPKCFMGKKWANFTGLWTPYTYWHTASCTFYALKLEEKCRHMHELQWRPSTSVLPGRRFSNYVKCFQQKSKRKQGEGIKNFSLFEKITLYQKTLFLYECDVSVQEYVKECKMKIFLFFLLHSKNISLKAFFFVAKTTNLHEFFSLMFFLKNLFCFFD